MIENPVHSLTFGDLILVEDGQNPPDDSGVVYRVKAQEATFGTAVPVTTALLWLGRAGGPVSYDRTPNREPAFRITVEADDSDLLARGEMALQLQCEQPTELVWTPPDGASLPSVFDIVWSHLEPVFDRDGLVGVGMEETLLHTRTYMVRMQALPYARGKDLVVTPAAPPSPTFTVLDNGSALSGAGFAWSAFGSSVLSIDAGRIKLVAEHSNVRKNWAATRTGAVDLTTEAYVAVDLAFSVPAEAVFLGAGGATWANAATTSLGGGVTRYFFAVPPGTTTVPILRITVSGRYTAGSDAFWIDQVQTVDALPFIGTARQRALSITAGGSVRTQGSIHVTHPSSPLGKTIVFTHPSGNGYLPSLRQYLTNSMAVSTDAARISGKYNGVGDAADDEQSIFQIPSTVMPKGRAELWCWLKLDATETITVYTQAVTYINGVTINVTQLPPTTIAFIDDVYQLICLGAFTAPLIDTGSAGSVGISIDRGPVVSGGLEFDEGYLFATELGSLTVVNCGTGSPSPGGPSRHLWIDAPTPAQPMGGIYRGDSADRSDAWHAGGNANPWGTHDFDPAGTSVFVVTQNAVDAATSLEHHRRYHTYVARED